MSLWTWQSPEVLAALLRGEPWRATTTASQVQSGLGDGFLAAYLWLAAALSARLRAPPPGVTFPVWAYAGAQDARADWRKGEQPATVKLRLQVPEHRLIRSGLLSWSDAAAGLDLKLTDDQTDAFYAVFESYARTLPSPVWNGEALHRPDMPDAWLLAHHGGQTLPAELTDLLNNVTDSWQGIFKLDACREAHEGEIVQACLWEIRPEDLAHSWSYPERA